MRRNLILGGLFLLVAAVAALTGVVFVLAGHGPGVVASFEPNGSGGADGQNISGSFRLNVTFIETKTNITNVTWIFSNRSGLQVVNVSNGTSDNAANVSWYFQLTTISLNEGLYNISFNFTNTSNIGNTSNEANASNIYIDRTVPTVFLNDTNQSRHNFSSSTLPAVFMVNASVNDSGGQYGGNLKFVAFNLSNASGQINLTNYTIIITNFNISFNFTNLADVEGGYNITVIANDSAQNFNRSEVLSTIVVDRFGPNATLTSPAVNTSTFRQNLSGVFNFTAFVNDSHGVKSVLFNLSNRSLENVTTLFTTNGNGSNAGSNFNATFTSSSVSDGTYIVIVQATDFAGNQNFTTLAEVGVDNTKPTVVLNESPQSKFNFTSSGRALFTINASINDTSGAGSGNIRFILFNISNASGQLNITADGATLSSIVNGTCVPNCSSASGGPSFNVTFNFTNFADVIGGYNITIVVNDSAGNYNRSVILENIVVDLSAPNATLFQPTVNTTTSRRNISGVFILNASVNDTHGVKSVSFNLSNSSGSNATPLFTANGNGSNPDSQFNATFTSTSFSDGTYNIILQTQDFAGNQNYSTQAEVGVDNTKPTARFNYSTGREFNYSSTSVPAFFSINATVNDTAGNGIGNIRFVLFNVSNSSGQINITADGATLSSLVNGTCAPNCSSANAVFNFTLNTTNLADGHYNITLVVNDSAGNFNRSEYVTISLDRNAPNAFIIAPQKNTTFDAYGPLVVLNATVSDVHAIGTVIFNITNGSGNQVTSLIASPINATHYNATLNLTTLIPRGYNLSVIVNDTAGNRNTSELINFTVIHFNITSPSNSTDFRTDFNITENISRGDINTPNDYIAFVVFEVTNETGSLFAVANQTNQSLTRWSGLVNLTNLTDGQNYTVIKNVTFRSGTSIVKSLSFTVDKTVPSISSFTCTNINTGGAVACSCAATDNYGDVTISYSTGCASNGAVCNAAGTYAGDCTATDEAGNTAEAHETFTVTAGGGGGGGGGSGGGVSTSTASTTSDKVVWTSIFAGETATVTASNTGTATGVDDLTFSLERTRSGIVVELRSATVSQLPAAAPKPAAVVYSYIEIRASGVESSDISAAEMTFTVPKSWLVEQGATRDQVVLHRLVGTEWTALPTRAFTETDAGVTFKATLPGFSFFAIALKGAPTAVQPTPAPAPAEQPAAPAPTTAPADQAAMPEKPAAKSKAGTVALVVVLVIVVLAVLIYLMQRKK